MPVVVNSILWDDSTPIVDDGTSSTTVTYSDVRYGWPGTGNIDLDPLFIDPSEGEVHISPDSPCVDAGSNAAPGIPPLDYEGNERVLDGDCDETAVVDMGADELFVSCTAWEVSATVRPGGAGCGATLSHALSCLLFLLVPPAGLLLWKRRRRVNSGRERSVPGTGRGE